MHPKLTTARTQLLIKQPFFGSLALRLKIVEKPEVKTAGVDGATLFYNPAWVDTLTAPQCIGLVAHEVMHCALKHFSRIQPHHKAGKANAAMDYAINPLIVESGLELPPGGLLNQEFAGMSWEEIYTKLPDDQEHDRFDVHLPPGPDQPEIDTEWDIAVKQAVTIAKMAGKLTGNLERFAAEASEKRIPWQQILHRFMTERSRSDYSWHRPNRQMIQYGMYLPSLYSQHCAPLIIAIDTSGSITDDDLQMYTAEINGLLDQMNPEYVDVVYCDTKINRTDRFEPGKPIQLRSVGGGGTDFRPVFDYINAMQAAPAALLYFTDLYGTFPQESEVPTLWITETRSVAPPFGEVALR